jgi:hypothetical protein
VHELNSAVAAVIDRSPINFSFYMKIPCQRYDTDSARDSLNVLEELIYECR